MLDTLMPMEPIPMVMEPTTLVRGLLKLNQRPRLILPYSMELLDMEVTFMLMELMDMLDTLTPMELTTLEKDLLMLSQRLMLPISMVHMGMLVTMDMLDILMLMVHTPTAMATLDEKKNSASKSRSHSDIC